MANRYLLPKKLFPILITLTDGRVLSVGSLFSSFNIYENLFHKYIDKKITFVEFGVAKGGSLFMWRDYFGNKAKIIGVDLNPEAKKLEKFGFDIVIGDQSKKSFWKYFFSKVGKVDILLDDGGHTNIQQISTLANSINNINDGGMIVIEDTQTSYIKKGFGNPSTYSFINFSKCAIDAIHRRSSMIHKDYNIYTKKIYSISYYESLAAFHIDGSKCTLVCPASYSLVGYMCKKTGSPDVTPSLDLPTQNLLTYCQTPISGAYP